MPAEDAMKGKRREAWFCYAADERLVSMTDPGPARPGAEARK
jgi:hypothetical protein